MKNERLLLLGTFLKSSGNFNAARHSGNLKKKNKARSNLFASIFLGLVLALYMGGAAYGIAYLGMGEMVPFVMAFVVTMFTVFFSLLKVNGYLFNFKGSEMLLAMPFHVGKIVSAKIIEMYLNDIAWNMLISCSMLVGLSLHDKLSCATIILWLVLSLFMPVVPLILAATLGIFAAKLGGEFKHKKILTTVFTFVLVIPCFFISPLMNRFMSDRESVERVLSGTKDVIFTASDFLIFIKWFCEGVLERRISSILLLVGSSLLIFELFSFLVEKNYLKIVSKLVNTTTHSKLKKNAIRQRSVVLSICFKEFKMFLGSTNYTVNAGMGQVIVIAASIASFFFDIQKAMYEYMGVNSFSGHLEGMVPLFVYFMLGMVATTTISPSMEGKSYWIVQTLPITKMTLFKGKMLFNLFMTVPFGICGVICIDISAGAGIFDILAGVFCIVVLSFFCTVFGLVRGVKHMRLDWEADIEIVKKGRAVGNYMFGNMLLTIGAFLINTVLCTLFGSVVALIFIAVLFGIFTMLSYLKLCKLAQK